MAAPVVQWWPYLNLSLYVYSRDGDTNAVLGEKAGHGKTELKAAVDVEALVEARRRAGLQAHEVSALLGKPENWVERLERYDVSPTPDELRRIAGLLGVRLEQI